MIDSAALITDLFSYRLPAAVADTMADFRKWIEPILDNNDNTLVKELAARPDDPGTQKKLKAAIASIVDDEPMRKKLLEKLASSNKILNNQAISNRNATINKQIIIQQHTGDIHIHYDTKEEQKTGKAVALLDIRMLMASGDTKQAIEKLLQQSKQNNKLLNESIMVAGRFNRLNKEIDAGIVSNENSRIEMARISQAVLHYVEQMETE